MKIHYYAQDRLTIGTAMLLANGEMRGEISPKTREKVIQNWQIVQDIVRSGKVVYGINTGFGSLCTTVISAEDTQLLQENLLRSHSVGVGEAVPLEVGKLMLILKLQSLSYGFSGISIEVLERIIWHIDRNIIPFVPIQGSVGASGDLAPLAHLFLPLIGLGKVWYKNAWVQTAEMLAHEKQKPLKLGAKEGLALINGTQFIAAYAVRGMARFANLLDTADIIGAMSLEGLLGSVSPFDADLHELRPFLGAKFVAFRLRTLLAGSEMVESHKDCGRVQDPYSIRCMPQVHGASRNAWLHAKEMLLQEINSVTDNPIIFDAEKTISGGNFHGQLMALPLDYVTLAAAELGNISDRRSYLLLEGKAGLPSLLMRNTGINSGFMIPQYTSAALVSENKSLCFPASADSIPTSLGQEDHVSMGSISSRKFNQVLDNLENILAVELLCAAQAFDFRKPLKSTKILDNCQELVRKHIDHAEKDRIFGEDIEKAHDLIRDGKLAAEAQKTTESEKIDWHGEWKSLFSI